MIEPHAFSYKDFFPYPSVRDGQLDMMQLIEQTVRAGKDICVEAPNGFGKTCTTLCGVLPWIKENEGKILYCARTHRQLDRVVEELNAVVEKNDAVTGISFRGRTHMCLNEFVLENADYVTSVSEVCGELKTNGRCPFYETLQAVKDPKRLLDGLPKKIFTASEIVNVARARGMCPYEMAKKLVKVVDVVALSYLYVFDPFILESFMPEIETAMKRVVLVQDEAHNVPSTALDSASDALTIGTIRQAMREATSYQDTVSRDFCKGLAETILDIAVYMSDEDEKIISPEGIYTSSLDKAKVDSDTMPLHHMEDLGKKIRRGQLKAGRFPRSAIFKVATFLQRWLHLSKREDYTFILSSTMYKKSTKRVALEIVALDPTTITSNILRMIHSSVAVSGTISPIYAYSEMLGFSGDAVNQTFRSPFARQNRLCFIVDGIDTSYKNRSRGVFNRMVDHCVAVAHATPGNTGIFTTSYYIAQSLIKAGLGEKLKKPLFLEKQGMKGTENDELVEAFKRHGENKGAVLLGVQGGRNSEGGDFPGSDMESVIVVGVPYARPTPRIEALIAYFDKRFNGKGRDYAYVLPAMTRAIQAAGRPVRRLDDKGVIVMLDQRFGTPYLKRFLPSWLTEITQVIPDNPSILAEQVDAFFTRPQI
ncbi:MAG: ATP-dependent DNA helicase [Candidatus Thorarchaeota archaeon]|nr:MAG: ATP-dependent DNA helicase [Candidatus Thorarchaeota archaeon]